MNAQMERETIAQMDIAWLTSLLFLEMRMTFCPHRLQNLFL